MAADVLDVRIDLLVRVDGNIDYTLDTGPFLAELVRDSHPRDGTRIRVEIERRHEWELAVSIVVLAASVAAKGFFDEFGKQLAQLLTKRLFRGKVEIGIPDESSPDTGRGGETILDAAEARSVDEISRALGISGLRGVERIRIVRTIRIHAAEDFSRHRRNDY